MKGKLAEGLPNEQGFASTTNRTI